MRPASLLVAAFALALAGLSGPATARRHDPGKLPPELEAQKDHLYANVLMYQGKFDEAIRLLVTWKGSPGWSAYARFNLGVALVRQKRLADADPFLTAVGTMYAETPEMLALK